MNELKIDKYSSEKLSPWFVTGFCDGEAAFTYSRGSTGVAAYFAVKTRLDDANLVKRIRIFFGGIGNIYLGKGALPKKNSGHTKPYAYYRVMKAGELQSVIRHFEKYPLQGKKRQSYLAWKKLVEYKLFNYGRRDEALEEALLGEISKLNQRGQFIIHGQGNRDM